MTGKPSSSREILAIVNPTAGGGRGGRRFALLRGSMERWPGRLRVQMTTKQGDAERLAAAASADGVDLVVAVGGDGTVHEVVNGILTVSEPGRPALTIAPVGTGCDFARSLDISETKSAREPRRSVMVDVGRVCFGAGAGMRHRFFLNAANMGAGTESARRVKESALLKRAGGVAYVVAGIPEVITRPVTKFAWSEPDGDKQIEQLLHLSVCNGPRFGGGLMLAPEATLFDGSLHVARLEQRSFGNLLRTLSEGYSERRQLPPGVSVRRVTELHVDGTATIEADGEILGALPADFSVLPSALKVLLP